MGKLNARSVVLVLMMVFVVSMVAIFAMADPGLHLGLFANTSKDGGPNHVLQGFGHLPKEGFVAGNNISGSSFIFTFTNVSNATAAVAAAQATYNRNVTNITLSFYLITNNSFMGNFTFNTGTGPDGPQGGNQSYNVTVNTLNLPDGVYNVTLTIFNGSLHGANQSQNLSQWINLTVDNTPPRSNLSSNKGDYSTLASSTDSKVGVSVARANVSLYAFAEEHNLSGAAAHLTVERVIFSFSNGTRRSDSGFFGTGTPFNLTATNVSGNWTVQYNLSWLRPGWQVITIISNDTRANVNGTGPAVNITFFVNSPANVTIWTNQSINRTLNGQILFNVSVNVTPIIGVVPTTAAFNNFNITLEFDNATGTNFNISNVTDVYNFNLTEAVAFTQVGQMKYLTLLFNVSNLVEGTHTVKIHINDSIGNINKTQVLTFRVDSTAPTVSVSCNDATAGATVTCTCTASDSVSGMKTTVLGSNSGVSSATESTTASGSSGSSSTCTATDHSGNSATATDTWTVTAASSGGGGSAGASGGSSSGGASAAKKTWTSIAAGETAAVESKTLPVEKVEFTTTKEVYGAWVRVEAADRSDLPSAAAAALTGKVNSILEISKNNIVLKEGVLNPPTVSFKVAKTWLSENGVGASNVVLLRLVDGTWTELATTQGADDGTYVRYTATTPGFSYFAIAEKGAATGATSAPVAEPVPTGAATTEPTPTEAAPVAPVVEESGGSSVLLWVVVLGVIVGVVVYFVRKNA